MTGTSKSSTSNQISSGIELRDGLGHLASLAFLKLSEKKSSHLDWKSTRSNWISSSWLRCSTERTPARHRPESRIRTKMQKEKKIWKWIWILIRTVMKSSLEGELPVS